MFMYVNYNCTNNLFQNNIFGFSLHDNTIWQIKNRVFIFLDSSKDCVKGFVHSNFNVAQRARMLDILNIIHYEWEEGKRQSTKNWKRNNGKYN